MAFHIKCNTLNPYDVLACENALFKAKQTIQYGNQIRKKQLASNVARTKKSLPRNRGQGKRKGGGWAQMVGCARPPVGAKQTKKNHRVLNLEGLKIFRA